MPEALCHGLPMECRRAASAQLSWLLQARAITLFETTDEERLYMDRVAGGHGRNKSDLTGGSESLVLPSPEISESSDREGRRLGSHAYR